MDGIVLSKNRVLKWMHQRVSRMSRELKPRQVILFGSYAYGKPTFDSDLDPRWF